MQTKNPSSRYQLPMSETNKNTDNRSPEIEPEQLLRLLDLELMQKRAAWKQTGARNRSRRISMFAFLFILAAACAMGFFFLLSKVSEERANRPPASEPSAPDR